MRTQRGADIVVGCCVALLGVFVLASATWISVAGVHRLSPRTFPYAVGLLLLACGLALALKSWTLAGAGPTIAWPDGAGVRTIVISLLGIAGYIAVMDWLGLPLASFLYLTLATWYLKPSRWLVALAIGLLTGGTAYLLFIRLLGLSFPVGVWFE